MSRLPEPRRLMSRAPKDSPVRLALTAARAREPQVAELRALAGSLLGVMADGPGQATTGGTPSAVSSGAAAGTTPLSRGGGALLTKLGSVTVMVALAAGGFWWTQKRASPGKLAPGAGAVERVKQLTERSRQAVGSESTAAPPGLTVPTQAWKHPCANPACAGSKRQALSQRADTPASSANLAPSSRSAEAAQSEVEMIDQARAALGSAPARALALAEQHEHRFPHGSMAEERDVIRISALMGLGQTSRAQALAREFLRVNSGSAYARRVEAVLSPN